MSRRVLWVTFSGVPHCARFFVVVVVAETFCNPKHISPKLHLQPKERRDVYFGFTFGNFDRC